MYKNDDDVVSQTCLRVFYVHFWCPRSSLHVTSLLQGKHKAPITDDWPFCQALQDTLLRITILRTTRQEIAVSIGGFLGTTSYLGLSTFHPVSKLANDQLSLYFTTNSHYRTTMFKLETTIHYHHGDKATFFWRQLVKKTLDRIQRSALAGGFIFHSSKLPRPARTVPFRYQG